MNELTAGSPAPNFSLPATGGAAFTLSDFLGQKIVLFFYSKDNTSGCTNEVIDFRDLYPGFATTGAQIFGISRDSIQSHEKFSAKLGLPYKLLSDADGKVCQMFDVIKEKNMYGKKVIGVERSTFIIGPDGNLDQAFRKVKVAGHAQAVLNALKA